MKESDEEKIAVFIDLGCCADCKRLMSCTYGDVYVSTDGKCIAVPEGIRPPTFICSRGGSDEIYEPAGLSFHDHEGEDVAPTSCEFYEGANNDD